ncbi:uncharacterized protein BXZ73DRAFT_42639 [Epithele typhae]|uniref:uncharacterized protein n=1 Tax=Epithele typhae TaxID=378194 RepID=UPI0020089758|nr:uncharacterized protein BXZ73DRAFT_42639 [Epithele typhae]KAH9940372.1 hypothetical protein BXZ73DRAFT_42639 [Epithele typhae]
MPLPSQFQSGRYPPPRTDSLSRAAKHPIFATVEDELRDIRRVHSQGQEEDLRYALGKTINKMEELTSMLREAYKAQTDLQTELTLAKSNLQLALANNEMLEDALRRDPGHNKDVGWRRMSAREQMLKAEADTDRRRSTDSLTSTDYSASPTASQPSSALPSAADPRAYSPIAPRSATMPVPSPSPAPSGGESRFFRFRFGSNATTPTSHPSSPRLSAQPGLPMLNGNHLTSASLPSLVPPRDWEKEVEELQNRLEAERQAHKKACDAKIELEGELESLSQALFEEANNMVATERMKRAETEEQLREAREQGEALKNVLRLFERDAATSKSTKRSSVIALRSQTPTALQDGPIDATPQPRTRHHRASSSAVGIKAPSSGIPSPTSRSASPISFADPAPAPSAVDAVPAESPISPPLDKQPPVTRADAPAPLAAASQERSHSLQVEVTTPADNSAPPTPSPGPSPLSGGQFLFTPPQAVNYYDGEESPWADAPSSTSRPVSS